MFLVLTAVELSEIRVLFSAGHLPLLSWESRKNPKLHGTLMCVIRFSNSFYHLREGMYDEYFVVPIYGAV